MKGRVVVDFRKAGRHAGVDVDGAMMVRTVVRPEDDEHIVRIKVLILCPAVMKKAFDITNDVGFIAESFQ